MKKYEKAVSGRREDNGVMFWVGNVVRERQNHARVGELRLWKKAPRPGALPPPGRPLGHSLRHAGS